MLNAVSYSNTTEIKARVIFTEKFECTKMLLYRYSTVLFLHRAYLMEGFLFLEIGWNDSCKRSCLKL